MIDVDEKESVKIGLEIRKESFKIRGFLLSQRGRTNNQPGFRSLIVSCDFAHPMIPLKAHGFLILDEPTAAGNGMDL